MPQDNLVGEQLSAALVRAGIGGHAMEIMDRWPAIKAASCRFIALTHPAHIDTGGHGRVDAVLRGMAVQYNTASLQEVRNIQILLDGLRDLESQGFPPHHELFGAARRALAISLHRQSTVGAAAALHALAVEARAEFGLKARLLLTFADIRLVRLYYPTWMR